MFTEDKVTEIFFMVDEFYKVFCRMLDKYSLNTPKMTGKRLYHRAALCTRYYDHYDTVPQFRLPLPEAFLSE